MNTALITSVAMHLTGLLNSDVSVYLMNLELQTSAHRILGLKKNNMQVRKFIYKCLTSALLCVTVAVKK